ncbi:MAG: SRPBCC domain-containing protein [Cyclobacteriaceae bacterium]
MEFTLERHFPVPPEKLYAAWLDSDEHSDMTGGDALITDELDDRFTAWDGYIWGKNLELKPNEYIKQSWKTSEFEEGQDYSIVELWFQADDDGTKLTLKHSNLSDKDGQYEQGWEDHYFKPMSDYFS